MKHQLFFSTVFILNFLFVSCTSAQPEIDNIPSPLPPTGQISTPIITDTATEASITEPVVVGISNGSVIYDDTNNIVSVNLDTGETKILVSRKEIQAILTSDKSSASYTYGREKPIEINLSPDFTKAHVSICASLDSNFRCVFEDYIYTLKSKSAIRLQAPPDSYGVYWQWSPDGSKLAGAAWNYVGATYQLLKYYSINNDGSQLRAMGLVTNDHWQINWHPGNAAILPLTYVQNFRSILTDGSSEPSIVIPGLAWNDKVICVGFSPDYSKVAFVIRHEIPIHHDWLYIARSDFQEISPITDFPNDARYSCQLNWSADQNFIHLDYQYFQREETGVEDLSIPTTGIDKVINLTNKQEVTTPTNAQVCGFASDNLIYINRDTSTMDFLNLTGSNLISLSDEVKSAVQRCPIQWFAEEPELDISEGIQTENACHPNSTYTDNNPNADNIPAVFDLTEASSSLNGETLNIVLKSKTFTEYLVEYLTPGVTNFLNGWDVFVDVDNNILTGDELGVEYRLSVAIRAGNEPQIGSVILVYDALGNTFTRFGTLDVRFDTLNQTLNFSGSIPEISQNSRLVFLSRLQDANTATITGDRICQ